MINSDWTNEEIEEILIQLDDRDMPFNDYALRKEDGHLKLLGEGGSALVFQAVSRTAEGRADRTEYALKVIGFGSGHVDAETFYEIAKAQKELSEKSDRIVKVYDYSDIAVLLDDKDRVIAAVELEKYTAETDDSEIEGNRLDLQFIVMERDEPVISSDGHRNAAATQRKLAEGCEQEVLNLAIDIGNALSAAHSGYILHRDVKLENIFYSPKDKHYKLGDFGFAKITRDRTAGTIIFSEGYVAPEVVGIGDTKYNNTADIYSLGMALFVILNGMRFPGSDSYEPNIKEQYNSGYVLPKPLKGSRRLCEIIRKMCMFDPKNRYQSIKDAVTDLEKIEYNGNVSYKKDHEDLYALNGIVMFVLGTVLCKLSFIPRAEINWPWYFLILFILSSFKALASWKFNTKSNKTTFLLLGFGLVMTFISGFTWSKILLVVICSLDLSVISWMTPVAVLMGQVSCLIVKYGLVPDRDYSAVRSIAAAAVLMSFAMFIFYFIVSRNEELAERAFRNNGLIRFFIFIYAVAAASPFIVKLSAIRNSVLSGTGVDIAQTGTVCGALLLIQLLKEVIDKSREKTK